MATVASYGWGDSEKVGRSVMKSMPASIALEYHDMFLPQSSLLLCPFYQLMQIFWFYARNFKTLQLFWLENMQWNLDTRKGQGTDKIG